MLDETTDRTVFSQAVQDYRYLRDRGYPVDPALQLVGDRYRLTRITRMVLYRGVSSADADSRRMSRRLDSLPPAVKLSIDGYNVLLTIANYLLGRPVFICSDGFLRDVGAGYSRASHKSPAFLRAEQLMVEWALLQIKESGGSPPQLRILLDRQVSHSGVTAARLRSRAPDAEVICVGDVDAKLKTESGVIATSDSAVIDQAAGKVIDAARHILEAWFSPEFERVMQ
ncbi:MAG: DUF434 domain-containing protein [Spirochaeta sp.]